MNRHSGCTKENASPDDLFGGDGTAAAGGPGTGVTSAVPVGCRVRGMVMRGAGRPLDDRVAGTRWTVVSAMVARLVTSAGLEILGLVARAAAPAPEKVRAGITEEVRAASSAAPLQFLKLRAVILRAARHDRGHSFFTKRVGPEEDERRRKFRGQSFVQIVCDYS